LSDIAKLDGDGAHQGAHRSAHDFYRALLIINDTDPAQFWPAMPVEVRAEAHTILDRVIEKLLTLSMQEHLASRAGSPVNNTTARRYPAPNPDI
jgi:hypothetical protein